MYGPKIVITNFWASFKKKKKIQIIMETQSSV